jgi:hypothetical protein
MSALSSGGPSSGEASMVPFASSFWTGIDARLGVWKFLKRRNVGPRAWA